VSGMSGKRLTARSYFVAWASLVLLSASTLLLSFAPLGGFHAGAAVLIAGIKAGIIVLVFMHLAEQSNVQRLALIFALLLLAILVTLTAADVATRHVTARPPVVGDR